MLLANPALIGFSCRLTPSPSVKLYARAQFALHDTFAQPKEEPADLHGAGAAKLPSLLKEAELATVLIPAHAAVSGKLISELQLRGTTGASIVGIERKSGSIINPPAHEELLAGDEVLLIGSPAQLVAARAFLESVQT